MVKWDKSGTFKDAELHHFVAVPNECAFLF